MENKDTTTPPVAPDVEHDGEVIAPDVGDGGGTVLGNEPNSLDQTPSNATPTPTPGQHEDVDEQGTEQAQAEKTLEVSREPQPYNMDTANTELENITNNSPPEDDPNTPLNDTVVAVPHTDIDSQQPYNTDGLDGMVVDDGTGTGVALEGDPQLNHAEGSNVPLDRDPQPYNMEEHPNGITFEEPAGTDSNLGPRDPQPYNMEDYITNPPGERDSNPYGMESEAAAVHPDLNLGPRDPQPYNMEDFITNPPVEREPNPYSMENQAAVFPPDSNFGAPRDPQPYNMEDFITNPPVERESNQYGMENNAAAIPPDSNLGPREPQPYNMDDFIANPPVERESNPYGMESDAAFSPGGSGAEDDMRVHGMNDPFADPGARVYAETGTESEDQSPPQAHIPPPVKRDSDFHPLETAAAGAPLRTDSEDYDSEYFYNAPDANDDGVAPGESSSRAIPDSNNRNNNSSSTPFQREEEPYYDHDAPAAAPGTGYEIMNDDDDVILPETDTRGRPGDDNDEPPTYKDSDFDFDGYGDGNDAEMMTALTLYQEEPFVDPDEEVDGIHKDDDEVDDEEEQPLDNKKKRRRIRKRKVNTNKDSEEVKKEKRRRNLCGLLCCLFCCLLIALIIWLIIFLLGRDEPEPVEEEPEEPEDLPYDDDFVPRKPYEGITTTPFDPYEKGECFFDENPHVVSQCQCNGIADKIANDTLSLYEQVRADINEYMYDGKFDEPVDSCSPENQALLWLSSGNTRDSGDFYQRYITALSFVAMNGTAWDSQNLWLSDESECYWFGLSCNTNRGLNSFALDAVNVHGSLPTEFVHLSSLRSLSLTRNHISGTIPPEYFLMPKLEKLMLYMNQLIGSIPNEVAHASNLDTLRLDSNLLFGDIATEIGKVTKLEYFSVGFNEFYRTIPTEIGLLTNLKTLVFEETRISGTLPTEFGRLSNLEMLWMSRVLMVGTIPTEFASMSKLIEFRAAHSGLGGTLPTVLAESLQSLNRWELGSNNFYGTVMTEFGLMTSLSLLSLYENDFVGTIPTELGHMKNMTRLSFKDNLLEGTVPSELGLLTLMKDLSLDKNLLTGSVPQVVCDLRKKDMHMFVTNCLSAEGDMGVDCPVDKCCTFCRRGEASRGSRNETVP